jgi:hypothetical protein
VVESLSATPGVELLFEADWPTRAAARQAIFAYVHAEYNRVRQHWRPGYVSPMQYDAEFLHHRVAAWSRITPWIRPPELLKGTRLGTRPYGTPPESGGAALTPSPRNRVKCGHRVLVGATSSHEKRGQVLGDDRRT